MGTPRIVISALKGGSGKTILSVGIIAAWAAQGKIVAPFKKGPDYIDAGWLSLAAKRPCNNLDTFLIDPPCILHSFRIHSTGCHAALIEGNRGLFDGIDVEGTTSTAELAKLLKAPVVLCLDCTKTTRTLAAVVLGCQHFDPAVEIRGVILNRVAGSRHEGILRRSVEHHCGTPVLGSVPKLDPNTFPERHMGLVPTPEHVWAQASIEAAARMARRYLDLERLSQVAATPAPLPATSNYPRTAAAPQRCTPQPVTGRAPRIGILRDAAFQFYYPENIEALATAGAEPVFISPLRDSTLPPLDGLYIGGGFPETHAIQLAENSGFRQQLKTLADGGLPIYAECGGLMYLGEALVLDAHTYPMAGVLPIVFGFSKRPQGHGYTILRVEAPNPFFEIGTELRGHEFHYSRVLEWRGQKEDLAFRMLRGAGLVENKDGVCYRNVLATYSHLHALGTPAWAESMARTAAAYYKKRAAAEQGGGPVLDVKGARG